MNIATERKAIEAALNNYRAQLDSISDEQFAATPPDGGWSYAEVYSHILQATLGSSIGLERCALGNCPPAKSGLNFLGNVLMFLGRFPPALRLKVPRAVAAKMPVTKIGKEDAKNLLIKCRRRMDDMMSLIKQSSPISRYKHPRLGMLNAAQWYKFIRIHLEHHLKQLHRIKNNLKGA
jgi:hypothetical protein